MAGDVPPVQMLKNDVDLFLTSGETMSWKLADEDGRAVDLLLDRSPSSGGNGNGGDGLAAPPHHGLQSRLQRLESLLGVLNHFPVIEPPQDLAQRTLQRLDGISPATFANQSDLGATRPTA